MEYFTIAELNNVKKQRDKLLTAYLITLAVFVAFSVVMFVWYRLLPYGSSHTLTVRLIVYPVTALFIIFSFIFLGLPYKRASKYYILCKHMQTGIREKNEGEFVEYDETKTIKDGVDMKALVFKEKNAVRGRDFERKVLVFYEKPFPEFSVGEKVKFITQGNVLIEYEKQSTDKGDK